MMLNSMSDLVDTLERRLGTRPLNLPENLQKDKWPEVITKDTLVTFSRYFPYCITVNIDTTKSKNGFYFLDSNVTEKYKIIGVKDIDWKFFAQDSIRLQQFCGYGMYDFLANDYGLEDVMMLQMRADAMSIFNNGIYVVYKPPNMIRIESVNGADFTRGMVGFPLAIFVEHLPNLSTIEPTKMEVFTDLAMADVATFLYNELKYYDNLETIFTNVNLRLDDLHDKANKREELVENLKQNYVSAANTHQYALVAI